MKKIVPFVVIVLFVACTFANADKTTGEPHESTVTEDTVSTFVSEAKTDAVPEVLLPVCTKFYQKVCLSGLASPDAILNKSGYYVLDLKSYKSALRKTGIFTDRFIAAQDSTFGECQRTLETEQLTEEEVWEGGIEMNAPLSCGFLDYAYYFNAQDEPDSFRMRKSSVNEDTAFTEMHFYSGESDWDDMVYLEVVCKKRNGTWCIDKVEKKSVER
jgi:hypothetical protein